MPLIINESFLPEADQPIERMQFEFHSSQGDINSILTQREDLESQISSEPAYLRQETQYARLLQKRASYGALHSNVVPFIWQEQSRSSAIKSCLEKWTGTASLNVNRNIDCGWANMTHDEKRYRVKYLWSRVRTVYNMIRFVFILREN